MGEEYQSSKEALRVSADDVSAPGGDQLWFELFAEAEDIANTEVMLQPYLEEVVLRHRNFASALGAQLAIKLCNENVPRTSLESLHAQAVSDSPSIRMAGERDLLAFCDRDPAAETPLVPFLYYKGFHALQWQRVAHWLWGKERTQIALFLQSRVAQVFAVDIHPAVPIGGGVFLDHATGVVIGETAVIGNDVSILHEVTLGGTGKDCGDRHPKIRDGVLLCAGAKILGNVEIGHGAKVGAGSVVVSDVPPLATVVGVPAKVVRTNSLELPAVEMDQSLPELGNYSI